MEKIISVKEYNQEARNKWQRAVDKWKPNEGGFPSLAMYLFVNQNTGEAKKTGYVGVYKKGAVWGKTKKEVTNKLKKVF